MSDSGSSSVDSNDPPPRVSAPCRDPDLVLSGASHEACGERRRVAEHGVRPPEARAHLAGEHASLAHADVHGERQPGVDDRAHRPEHPLLVVTEGLRRARDEDDPSAVAVDVALEERDAVLVRCRLYGADESIERVRSGLGPFGRDDLVRSGETDERDRRMAMLALERPDLEELRAQRRRNRNLERDAFDGRERRYRAADLGSGTEESPVALLLGERLGFEDARRLGAHEDLARLRGGLHLHRSGRRRAG